MELTEIKQAQEQGNKLIESCIIKYNGATYKYENVTPSEIIAELKKWNGGTI